MAGERWTGERACALQAAAGMTNERFAEWLGVAVRTIAYWHSRPGTTPNSLAQDCLDTALDRCSDAVRQRFAEVARTRAAGNGSGANSVMDAMSAAADDASNDELLRDHKVDPESVDDLRNDLILLARSGNTAAFDVFTAARRIRDDARELAERHRRPSLLADLYLIVGQASALMASTAFDLGHWNESAIIAQAATRYADLAGHGSLQAWTLGLRATLANWRNEPDMALAHFEQGLRVAPAGAPRFRLRYIASRSYALLEDSASVGKVLEAAKRDREDAEGGTDELSHTVGGEFAFGDARAAACAAAAWLDVRNGEEAERHAMAALEAYKALPRGRRPYSQMNGTQIDIAAARLYRRDRDGAAESLRDVLTLPAEKRNVSLTGRIAKVEVILAVPPWENDPEAQRIARELAEWQSATSARPLH